MNEKTKKALRKMYWSCMIVLFFTMPSVVSYMFHYPEFNKEGVTLISLILLTLYGYAAVCVIKKYKPNVNGLMACLAIIIILGVLLIVNMAAPAIVYTIGLWTAIISGCVAFSIMLLDMGYGNIIF